MKVSVIIPTFHRPDNLSELFDSLLKQTVKPIEVIVVDDTPSTIIEDVCRKYEVKFEGVGSTVVYVRNPKDRSAAIARNTGVEKAKGDIVMFLDSDVILYPDYNEKIVEVFEKHPNAVGVQGWIMMRKRKFYYPLQTFYKLFFLQHYAKSSCKYSEYPVVLTKIINCEWLHGSNMTVKRNIFNEFQFDENLKKYSYTEDLLFSHSIFERYSDGLFITPYAKCIHKVTEERRTESKELRNHKSQCRKYVLTKLFGLKGLLIYYWQSIGIIIIELLR